MTSIVAETDSKNGKPRITTTVFDIVTAVSDVAASDAEIVAVLHHILDSGRVRLLGRLTDWDVTGPA